MAGILFSQSYFDRAYDRKPRSAANGRGALTTGVDWPWEQVRRRRSAWADARGGFPHYDWRGYNEAMIVLVLALAPPPIRWIRCLG